MSTNERTNIRTIVKWSKSAAVTAVIAVLLVASVFVQRVYAQSLDQAQTLSQSQQETSKTKAQLEDIKSEKAKLQGEVQVRDTRITQLEQENAELKE